MHMLYDSDSFVVVHMLADGYATRELLQRLQTP